MGNHYPPVRKGLLPTTTAFGRMLREIREDKWISQSRVAKLAGFNHSYLSRLESGGRVPSREAVLTIARVMRLSGADTDALLMAAGYMPTRAASVIDQEPVVARLYEFLCGEGIPEAVKENVRTQVLLTVEQVDALVRREGTEAA